MYLNLNRGWLHLHLNGLCRGWWLLYLNLNRGWLQLNLNRRLNKLGLRWILLHLRLGHNILCWWRGVLL